MNILKATIAILGWVVLIAVGAFADIYLLLVHGIREIVQGASAHPVSGNLIGWGAAHVVFSGIGIFIGALLGMGWAALWTSNLAGKSKYGDWRTR